MTFNSNERTILFEVLERGPIEKELLTKYYNISIINDLIRRGFINEIEIRGEKFLIISRDSDPVIRRIHEDYCYKFTRCSREIVTLINTCLGDRPNIR